MIIGIIPCVVVTSLETDAFVAFVAYMLMVRSNLSAGSRKEGTQGTVAILSKKKKVQGCESQNSDPTNSILRKARELGLNASAGHTWNSQNLLGTKLNSGKRREIWRHYPERWTSWAKSLRARFWGMNTWGNLVTSRLWLQSNVKFGEKKVLSSDKRDTSRRRSRSPTAGPSRDREKCK